MNTSSAQKPYGRPQLCNPTSAHVVDQAAPAKPRIMLIGWLGAQKHHLNKCAALTSCRSCSSICSQSRSGMAMCRSWQVCAAVAEQGL